MILVLAEQKDGALNRAVSVDARGIVQALKYGDLEEAEAAPPGEGEGGTEGSENPTGRRSPPEGRRNRAETEPEKPTVQ